MKCSNCGRQTEAPRDGLCHRCYKYQHRNGKPRPPVAGSLRGRNVAENIKYRDILSCTNCGSGDVYAHGLCTACAAYRNLHGEARPPHLHKPPACSPGLCDNPATTSRIVLVGYPKQRHVRIPLCEECAKLHDEMQAETISSNVPIRARVIKGRFAPK